MSIPTKGSILDHYTKQSGKRVTISNGLGAGVVPTMSPERLKDFGAEEYLDHSIITAVETTETKEAPERHQCGSKTPETKRTPNSIKPKKKCASDSPCSSITTTPPPEYLTLENINMAAFQIQSGIPKTPCTVSQSASQ